MIVDGQLHGGIAQGVGQALWEGAVYSDDGQLLTGSMLDYALPRASWLPCFELDETVTPSPVNPLGVKGVGEAGAIASTPAVANAVIDALSPWASAISTCRSPPDGLGAIQGRWLRQRDRQRPREGRPRITPAAFEYTRAGSIDEALGARRRRRARRSSRAARACCRCSSSASPTSKRWSTSGGWPSSAGRAARRRRLSVGALTTYAELLDSPGGPLRAAPRRPAPTAASRYVDVYMANRSMPWN